MPSRSCCLLRTHTLRDTIRCTLNCSLHSPHHTYPRDRVPYTPGLSAPPCRRTHLGRSRYKCRHPPRCTAPRHKWLPSGKLIPPRRSSLDCRARCTPRRADPLWRRTCPLDTQCTHPPLLHCTGPRHTWLPSGWLIPLHNSTLRCSCRCMLRSTDRSPLHTCQGDTGHCMHQTVVRYQLHTGQRCRVSKRPRHLH